MRELRDRLPLIALLSAGRFLAFLARLGIVPFYPELMRRFGASYTGAGALFSAFFVGYAASLIPAGSAADRGNPRRLFALGLLLLLVSGATVALTRSYVVALAARAVEGLAVALVYTTSLKLVVVRFARDTRGRVVGVMETATSLGQFTALSLLTVLSQWFDHVALLLVLPALTAAAFFLVPSVDAGGSAGPISPVVPRAPMRELMNRNLGLIIVTSLLGLFVVNGALGWLPTHLTQVLGHSKITAGIITGVVLAGQVAGTYPGGFISDRIGRRLPLIYFGSAMMMASCAGLAVVPGGAWIYLPAVILGVGMSVAITPLTVLAMESVAPERAGVIASITVATAQAGSGLAGVAFGWVLDRTGSFTAIWLVAAALAAMRLASATRIAESPDPRPASRVL